MACEVLELFRRATKVVNKGRTLVRKDERDLTPNHGCQPVDTQGGRESGQGIIRFLTVIIRVERAGESMVLGAPCSCVALETYNFKKAMACGATCHHLTRSVRQVG